MGLDQDEAFARIRLLRSPNVGPVTYGQLMARFGSARAVIPELANLAARGGARYIPADPAQISGEINTVKQAGARYLFHDSPEYPALLREMDAAPPILIMRGNPALLMRPAIAVVGARNASAAAIKLARDFSAALSDAGFVVVSGLARGIDGAAHQGAMAAAQNGWGKQGGTIAVIASGITVSYPPEHAALQEEIAQNGLLLSEQPPKTEPQARHFPSRNRIIAWIASGTLVVEAAPRSGSLITAQLASEAGREIMAIPGSPLDARSKGCNRLIRDGAILVQSPEDVIELVTDFSGQPRSSLREEAAVWQPFVVQPPDKPADILPLLTTAPVAVDELIRQSGASAASVQLALIELELAGRLTRHAAGRVSLAS